MRKFLYCAIALLLIATLSGYALWTQERPTGHYLSDLRIQLALDEGVAGERGNLLGIQPALHPADYQSRQRLHRKLAAYLEQARGQGLLNARTVVVLPEHIGTWLWACGEKPELYEAADRKTALQWLALSNPLDFLKGLLEAQGSDRLGDAFLRMKASAMATDYQQLFGGLAKEFGITLVAGSIVLPEPRVDAGQLRVGRGPLYNSSLVFGRDGAPLGQPQRQIDPDAEELERIAADHTRNLNVVDTPAGRLGILIGNDSQDAANYRRLDELAVQLVAVPALTARQPLRLDQDRASIRVSPLGQPWDRLGSAGTGAHLFNRWL